MKYIHKLICKIIGHRYRMLHFHVWEDGRSTSSGWECQCCGKLDHQQWDN